MALPPQFSSMHDVFHISAFKDYVHHRKHILNYNYIALRGDMSGEDKPVEIVERWDQVLRGITIQLVKVIWMNYGDKETTWEREDRIRGEYPALFTD